MKSRERVETLAGYGCQQSYIAHVLGISKPTLHKYYRKQLDYGMAKANASVINWLYQNCQPVPGKPQANQRACEWWSDRRIPGWQKQERREMTAPGGAPLAGVEARIIVYHIPDNGRLLDASVVIDPDVMDAEFEELEKKLDLERPVQK